MKPAVLLITGIDAVGVSRLPALFAAAGFEVVFLGSQRFAAAKSKFISDRVPTDAGSQAAASAAREHLSRHRDRYEMIVLAHEPTLWAALELGDREWLSGWFPIAIEPDGIERLRSKVRFLADACAAGITVPRFATCRNVDQLRTAAAEFGFPVFVKAPQGLAGSGLLYARNSEHLESQIGPIDYTSSVTVQQEIVGLPGSISVLYNRGRPSCWFAYLMKRTWPNRFASACTVEMFSHPDCLPMVEALGTLTGFHGLAGIDWMLNPKNNRLYFLEFNPRPTPVHYLGKRVGVDFARALRDHASGSHSAQAPNGKAPVIDLFPQSLYDAIQHMNGRQFIAAFRDAPWDDPRVAAAHLRRVLTHYLRRGLNPSNK